MRLIQNLRTLSLPKQMFLLVTAANAMSACGAGFWQQAGPSGNEQTVSPILLRSVEQEAGDGIKLLVNPAYRKLFAEWFFHAQLQARFLDTLPEGLDELAGTDETADESISLDAIMKSRKAMTLLGEGNLEAALGEISKLEYINQLATIRNATAWCIETGKTDWITPILEFDYDSRAPENEVWSTKAQIEETIRPLCLRDLALKSLMAGDREQAAKLALDAISQILDHSGGAAYYGILNDLDTYLDLAERCGVMKEAWERIRSPLLDGTLMTFAADSIAMRLAHSALKDELEELIDACETVEKRIQCNAAAAWGFATAGDFGEAILHVERAQSEIPALKLRTLDPKSFSCLVGACCLSGNRDEGAALIKQRLAEPGEMDEKILGALLERVDPELLLQLIQQDNITRWRHSVVGVARACKREKKVELARAWLLAKTDELRQMNFDFSRDSWLVGGLASAWAVLGDLEEANSILQEIDIPDYGNTLTREEAERFERFGGFGHYHRVAENMAIHNDPGVLVEWVTGLEHPLARAHAALGLFEGFAAHNHRLEGWYPR